MTRYETFRYISRLCNMETTGKHQYNKMIQSGGLVETHYDYGTGYYDVCISYEYINKKHVARVWFGTIDDGDYGSWNYFDNKEDAIRLVEKLRDKFSEITVLPGHAKLNEMFRELGVYFCNE